jgi:hypothetical protein
MQKMCGTPRCAAEIVAPLPEFVMKRGSQSAKSFQ